MGCPSRKLDLRHVGKLAFVVNFSVVVFLLLFFVFCCFFVKLNLHSLTSQCVT